MTNADLRILTDRILRAYSTRNLFELKRAALDTRDALVSEIRAGRRLAEGCASCARLRDAALTRKET